MRSWTSAVMVTVFIALLIGSFFFFASLSSGLLPNDSTALAQVIESNPGPLIKPDASPRVVEDPSPPIAEHPSPPIAEHPTPPRAEHPTPPMKTETKGESGR